MKPTKLLALCLAASLTAPWSVAHACVGGNTEVSLEGDPSGNEPVKILTPKGDGEPARAWVDDDGFPTIMAILQSVENKKDVSAYGDLFKKSLARLASKSAEYAKASEEAEAKAHYESIAKEAKKFLKTVKDRPLEKKDYDAFFKEMNEPLYGAVVDGVFQYQILDPKTGELEDADEPYAPIGHFGPTEKFRQKVEGVILRSASCGTFSLKVNSAEKNKGTSGAGTFMVHPE
jgi:hypothetical protein